MAKIALKEYIREINSLIEANQIDEAKQHCAYILKSYPKYIDVYRVLGKAHLQSQNYAEAEKVFVRVLAVLPDDFVSHLGMSVVKEEQENLDSAIWHMERAYELKSTQTIHAELHRLFTLRDGVAPPKPLITRGALIRINVRSGLFQQALKEIEYALKEDSQRLDLEILRAQIYYQQKNLPLAVRFCKIILQKRPYAYDANLLMTEIATTPEQAEPFKQRMFELDPYTSLVSENQSLEEVPEEAILIEKLDLPPFESPETEEFVQQEIPIVDTQVVLETENVSKDIAEQETEAQVESELPTEYADSTILEANTSDGDQIPDWMKEAGWDVGAERTADEEQSMIESFDAVAAVNPIAPASDSLIETDIPDWLKELAPTDTDAVLPSGEESELDEEGKLAWLNEILPENIDDKEPEEEPELTSSPAYQKPSFASVPEFGEDINADQEWLEMVSSSETTFVDPDQQSLDRPSRMPEQEEIMNFSFEEPENEEKKPIPQPEPQPEESGEEDIDSAIAWLEGLAARQGAEEEVLFSDQSAREEKPAWLEESIAEEEVEEEEFEIDEPSFVIEDDADSFVDENEQPEFESYLEEITEEMEEELAEPLAFEESLPEFGSPESITSDESMDVPDIPAWLKTIAPPESVGKEDEEDIFSEEIAFSAETEEESLEIPEDLNSLFEEIPVSTGDEELEPSFEIEDSFDDELSAFEEDLESMPVGDRFGTTGVLDFIKSHDDEESDEVDNWLKSLPQTPEINFGEDAQITEGMDEEVFSKEDFVGESSVEEAESQHDVEFIDEYFFEEMEETNTEEASEPSMDEPYQWEQEYEEISAADTDLPDWIAGIEEDEYPANEPTTRELVHSEEVADETTEISEMPSWMKADMQEKVESEAEFEIEVEQSEPEMQEEAAESFVEQIDETPLPVLPEELAVVEELAPEENVDYEEMFLIAKNKLHNGDFDDAFPRLKELLNRDQWQREVIDTLVYDIENYHPIEVESWVLLGDAYRKQGRLKEALDAYTKAEGFIK